MKSFRPDGLDPISSGFGNYYGKLYKIYRLTPDAAKTSAMEHIGPKTEADEFRALLDGYKPKTLDRRWADPDLDKVIYKMRKITFWSDDNDCTVAKTSSFGGLKPPYTFVAEHVLHGWAPRQLVVQDQVVRLLQDPTGEMFDPNGFPNYDGVQADVAAHYVFAGGSGGSGGSTSGGASTRGNTGGTQGVNRSLVGEWEWEHVVADVVVPQGTLTFAASGKVSGTKGQSGTWKMEGRAITIQWSSGRMDEVRMTSDGKNLLGRYNDDTVRGRRKG
jgi:hypothetical protein